jgi:hypothetical protein
METSLVQVFVYTKFQIKIRKYDFTDNLGPVENRHIKRRAAELNLNRNSNPFRILLEHHVVYLDKKSSKSEREYVTKFLR